MLVPRVGYHRICIGICPSDPRTFPQPGILSDVVGRLVFVGSDPILPNPIGPNIGFIDLGMFENTSRVKVFTIKFIYNYVYHVVHFLVNYRSSITCHIKGIGRNRILIKRTAKEFKKNIFIEVSKQKININNFFSVHVILFISTEITTRKKKWNYIESQ